MPLPRATARKLLHMRDIQLRGYEREDGMFDIEVRMTNIKTYSWSNHDRGAINAGDPLHDMWMRLTIDRDMTIQAVDAAMDGTPFAICPAVAPNYQRLIGLTIGRGFLKSAMQRLGGVEGCTHLRELLQPLATVAFQTSFSMRHERQPQAANGVPAALINTCHGYREDGDVVLRARAGK
jgi:hypothetical protein